MYSYRSLHFNDLPTICTFPQDQREAFFMCPTASSYPISAKELEVLAKERVAPTVVLHDQKVVGYANLYDVGMDSCSIGNVIVSPQYRGKKVAYYLIEVMEKIASEKIGVNKLKLVCHNTNTQGLLFYTKIGFKPYDVFEKRNQAGEYIALIAMEKVIINVEKLVP